MNHTQLSDLELLGRVIGIHEARRLYAGTLTPLFKAVQEEDEAQRKLAAAHELVKRWLVEELRRDVVFSSPALVPAYLSALFAGREYESFVVLFLDSQHRLIASEELFRGTIDSASVYPREVVKAALRHNAGAVIFGHNHPSGVAEPSAADRTLTDRLKQALALVEVRVLDHFVLAGANAVSFAEKGWI